MFEQKVLVSKKLLADLVIVITIEDKTVFLWPATKENDWRIRSITDLEWLEVCRLAELRLDDKKFGGTLSRYDKYAWELSARFGRSIRASIEERLECLAFVLLDEERILLRNVST